MDAAPYEQVGMGNDGAVGPGRLMAKKPEHEKESPGALYLDLLKKCLTRIFFPEQYQLRLSPKSRMRRIAWRHVQALLARLHLDLVDSSPVDLRKREEGLDLPAFAETMVGLKRLDNLQNCIVDILSRGIAGDLIETGV